MLISQPLISSNAREGVQRLRIACYGFAERGAGSISSAGSVICEQLLLRGHTIDFFGKSSFFHPTELESYSNFKFIEVPEPRLDRFATFFRKCRLSPLAFIASRAAHRDFIQSILRCMRRHHAGLPYDIQFWLGDWPIGRIGDTPVVTWAQGAPETDARSISRRKSEVIKYCGWKSYLAMRLFAVYRGAFGLPAFSGSDAVIVGSRWSRTRLTAYGVESKRISAVSYPVDLSDFRPAQMDHAEHRIPSKTAKILWLGRTVPRKRLDLFLDACGILLKEGLELQAMIVGGFGHFAGYRKMIDDFQNRYPGVVQYVERVARRDVIPLLQSVTVLVQPSEDEDFGSSVAEALACGTPVVVGPSNGTGDYIGEGGVRFDQYEPASVATAIRKVITGGSELRRLARAAAENHFDLNRITDRLEEILHAQISTSGREAPCPNPLFR